ncbi:MAG: hypothetical protein KDK70_30765, partial [Myxococcales bacterium]|nr:hypothetical protein [Myxococcales bacterium]
AWTLGYLALALAPSFPVFVAGQLLLAAGMAFNSGTDGALLYDSLLAQGRGEALAEHEGRAQARGLLAMGASALIGGAAASIDLRLGHLLSAGGAAVALGLALAFREPPAAGRAHAPLRQLGAVASHLRQPPLAWVFGFAVVMTVFNHVPYELAQPYLDLVLGESAGPAATPVVSGVVIAAMMTVAAGASRASGPLGARVGTGTLLLGAMVVQGVVIGAMAAWLHPVVLLVLLLRSVPAALAGPIQLGVILPRVEGRLRATYLSVQSLAGRLAFSGALVASAGAVGELDRLDHAAIQTLGAGFGVAWVVAFGLLALGAKALRVGSPPSRSTPTPG